MDPDALGFALERLAYRGPDGQDILLSGSLAMGHRHFWTTPEEVGERQPLEMDGLPFALVFDGRLDNREELFARLSLTVGEGRLLSDAALALQAYAVWGGRCVEYFLGEFALVCYDERNHGLFCARDHLGDRALYYASQGSLLAVASEPWAVLGALGVAPELDESAVAHYFGRSLNDNARTFFRGVSELPPAHILIVASNKPVVREYWQADVDAKIRYKDDEQYCEHFLSIIEESVRCRLRSVTPVGVQMSGGLDSTTLACLAARQLSPERLVTISNIFEELSGCDESQYIDAVQQEWNTISVKIPADEDWPYKNWADWPFTPNAPVDFPYRLLISKIYAEAQARGLRVLFTGDFGDHLFGLERRWLADYLLDARYASAMQELSWHLRQNNFPTSLVFRYLRPYLARLLGPAPNLKRLLRKPSKSSEWLTPSVVSHLGADNNFQNRRHARLGSLLSHQVARLSASEVLYSSPYQLEVRTPYRDRRLVEFFVALPAYQLYRRGVFKFIVRNAMKGVLPESVRIKHKSSTSFLPLYLRGLEEERPWLQKFFQNKVSVWGNYIRREWVDSYWKGQQSIENQALFITPIWSCVVFETWHSKVFSGS